MNIQRNSLSPVVAGPSSMGSSFQDAPLLSSLRIGDNSARREEQYHGLMAAALYCVPMVFMFMLLCHQSVDIQLPASTLVPYAIYFLLPPSVLAFFSDRFQSNRSSKLLKLCVLLAGLASGIVIKLLMR